MKNFEKFKTAKERTEACSTFLVRHNEYEDIPYIEAAMIWLDLEAEEETPLPCPFCGGDTFTVEYDFFGYWGVKCSADGCWYHSHLCKSESEAIAAHNRVAKAVMGAKESEVK